MSAPSSVPGLRALARVQSPPADPRGNAVRAGLAVAGPMVVLLALGRPDWAVLSVLGSLVSVYGRHHSVGARAGMQACWGAVLAAGAAIGTAVGGLPGVAWSMVAGIAVAAVAGGLLSEALDAHPPGPLYLVFCFGVCAARPVGEVGAGTAAAVVGASAGFAVLLGVLDPGRRGVAVQAAHRRRPELSDLREAALRYGLPAGGATGLAVGAGLDHPYWAGMAAVVPMMAATTHDRLLRGTHRVLGTLIGLGLAGVLLTVTGNPVVDLVVIAVLQTAAEMLILSHYGGAVVLITPFAILVGQFGRDAPVMALLIDRLLETALGVALACLVVAILHRARTRAMCIPAHRPCHSSPCGVQRHSDD